MDGFSPELQAKTKVDMWNIYKEKHGITRESFVLPGLLLLSNIETDQGYPGKRRASNNLWKKKITTHKSTIKKKQTNGANWFCQENYRKGIRYQIHV